MDPSPYSSQTPQPEPPRQYQTYNPPQTPYAVAPRITPGAGWYVLSLLFLLGGIGLASVLVVNCIRMYMAVDASLQYFNAPGQMERYLDKPGTYAVYLSYTPDESTAFTRDNLSITVTRKGQNQPLPLMKPKDDLDSFTTRDAPLWVLYTFSLPEPDAVTVSVTPAEGLQMEPTRMAIGSFFSLQDIVSFGLNLFGAAASGLLGLIIALVIFIITIVKRGACKRRLHMAMYPQNVPTTP
ncbi:MAG: hypothetical protein JXA11_10805 [Phycisphaerae bacterium]|nr:hypothetical protein [Phycisphaerae bacterium]